MIHAIFIIKDGVLLINQEYKSALKADMQLMSGFFSAIQSFSKEIAGSCMRSIDFEEIIFHFYIDQNFSELYYVIVTDREYDMKEIQCKILKIKSIFSKQFEKLLHGFCGNISQFDSFNEKLDNLRIEEDFCGDRNKCTNCQYRNRNKDFISTIIQTNEETIKELRILLKRIISQLSKVKAALLIDCDGFPICQTSNKSFNEEIIGSIISLLEPIIKKVNSYSNSSFARGIIDTNEFRLFYLDLGTFFPALFVLVSDNDSHIENYLPYSFIIAEQIVSNLEKNTLFKLLPNVKDDGTMRIEFPSQQTTRRNVFHNIYILGESKVGKTSLLSKYIKGNFTNVYRPTIGLSIFEKEMQVSPLIQVKLLFYDFGGIKNFAPARPFFYSIAKVDSIILVFDATDKESFINLNAILDECMYYVKDSEIPVILLANKIDLIQSNILFRREVDRFVSQYNCYFYKTSALTGQGIDEVFTLLLSNINFKQFEILTPK